MNRTLDEKGTCLLVEAGLSAGYWAEAMLTATFLINRLPSAPLKNKTPYELLNRRKPTYADLRTFGSECWAHVHDAKKMAPKSIRCIFLGYGIEDGKKAYRLMIAGSRKAIYSRDIVFHEPVAEERPGGISVSPDALQTAPAVDGTDNTGSSPPALAEVGEDEEVLLPRARKAPGFYTKIADQESRAEKAAAKRQSAGQADFAAAATVDGNSGSLREHVNDVSSQTPTRPPPIVPQTYQEAIESPYSIEWKAAMEEEMASLKEHKVWRLVELPKDRKAIGCRWVFALKRDTSGQVIRYKARLVVKGYAQVAGIDYDETYAPTSKINSTRAILALIAHEDLDAHQYDVKTAFLNSPLKEKIFMSQPPGFEEHGSEDLACELEKALYGLAQASAAWYARIDSYFDQIDLHHIEADHCVYVAWKDGQRLLLILYVDDMVSAGSAEMVDWFGHMLVKEFEIDDRGELGKAPLLGMEVSRDRRARTITLTQERYTNKIVETFGFMDANPVTTPMQENVSLLPHVGPPVEAPYREMVGSLMYLVNTRPELSFAVGAVSRYNANPGPQHLTAVRRIFRYVKGTSHFGLVLGGAANAPMIEAWADSDYAGDHDSRKSTTGFVIKLFGATIISASKKQKGISTSTLQAEYIALSATCKSLIWLRFLLQQLGYITPRTTVHSDNQGAIATTKNGTHSDAAKHIDVAHKFAREQLTDGLIELAYIRSALNLADVMTKALGEEAFEGHREALGVVDTEV